MDQKVNTSKDVRYVSKNFTTGLIDVTLNVREPGGTLFDFGAGTDLILTETTNGEYKGAYIPDSLGVWQERVVSTTNGDIAVRSFEVVAVDLDTIKDAVDTLGLSIAPGGYFSN